MEKIVITSGYFNPLHIGHLNLFKEAKNLGDRLFVIVNNDKQVRLKGAFPFMEELERVEIIKSIRHVDEAFLSIDSDRSVAKSIEAVSKLGKGELIFAKGGDRNSSNIPESELEICKKYNIKIVNDVGGEKVQSSSWLIKNSGK